MRVYIYSNGNDMHNLTSIDVNDDAKMTIDVKKCHLTLDVPGTILTLKNCNIIEGNKTESLLYLFLKLLKTPCVKKK